MTEEDFTREATQLLRDMGLKDQETLNFFQEDGISREDWKTALKKPSTTRARRVSSNDTRLYSNNTDQYSGAGMRRVTVSCAPSQQQHQANYRNQHRSDYKRTSSAGQALTNGGMGMRGYTRTAPNASSASHHHPSPSAGSYYNSQAKNPPGKQEERNSGDRKATAVQYKRRASAEKPNVNGVQSLSQHTASSGSRRLSLKEAQQQESKSHSSMQNGHHHRSMATSSSDSAGSNQQQLMSSTGSTSGRRIIRQAVKKTSPKLPPRKARGGKTEVLHEKKPSFQLINISTTSSTKIAQMVQDGRVTEKRKPPELTLKPQNQNGHRRHHHYEQTEPVQFTVGDSVYDSLSPSTEPAVNPLKPKDTASVYDRLTPREIAEIMKASAENEEQPPSKYQQPLKTNFPPSSSRRSSSSSTTSASSEVPLPAATEKKTNRPRHHRSSSDNPPASFSQQTTAQPTTGRHSADAARTSSLPLHHGRDSKASMRSYDSDSDRNFRSPLSSDVTLSSPETRGTPDSSERSSRLEVNFSRDALDSSMSEIATSTVQALSTLVEVITPTIQTEKKFWYENGFDDDDSSNPLSPVSSNLSPLTSPTSLTSPMSPVSPGGQTSVTTVTSPISHISTASTSIFEANRSQSTSLRNSTIFDENEEFFGFCARCSQPVVGVESGCLALDSIYHTECFTCARCKTSLMGLNFYTLGSYVVCERDFLKTLERCYACKQRIQNRVLRAFGRSYHAECFKCAVCGSCLDGLPHASDDSNRIYCISDFQRMFAPKCAVCNLPIAPQKGSAKSLRVVAMELSYHVDCYKCESCGKQLASKSAGTGGEKCYPLDGHLMCKACHYTYTAQGSSRGTEL